MNETHNRPVVVGVDAGGTRSRACLVEAVRPTAPGGPWQAGEVLGRGSGGPGNALSVCRADLTRHLTEAVGEALAEAEAADPGVRGRLAAAYGGFAGAAQGLGPERGEELAQDCLRAALAAHGAPGVPVAAGGDIDVALAAAPGAPADGLVLIAGTGAIAARIGDRRRAAVSDGHGWLLGDEGSGYWLGNHGVRAALEALDGRGPWTGLVPRVAGYFLPERFAAGEPGGEPGDGATPAVPGGEPGRDGRGQGGLDGLDRLGGPERHRLSEAIVSAAYALPPVRLAALSTAVAEAAAEGDPVAAGLLDTAADLLAGTVRSLDPRPGDPLVATGGLLAPGGPLLDRVTERLAGHGLRVFAVPDGSQGAAALACTLL
ncbi:N-acetylglucosamine kinase [Actinacidiphila yeochonensis]|uniref:N-acetylglucosamine kinase n=1 Tax=Actinacidiphila yeochonensis TaxID=89050 RepID=UPI00056D86CB|nr:BadF/BadG/BcrA/BcrD ATPase family protein [Actinacidiphila yeochonensis]